MTAEQESVPYESAALLGERVLVLAPHPDDEVIACGGLIGANLRAARQVRVLIATDGVAADESATDALAYRDQREAECRRGLSILGEVSSTFLRLPDRHLGSERERLTHALRDVLTSFTPDLIAVPSPIEIHPDHLALSRIFCELIQSDESLFATLATARVLFYEVSQPIRPNALLDITEFAERKWDAIGAHESQIAIRNYTAFAQGLNAYRAMTLGPSTSHAEAYWKVMLPELRTMPFTELQRNVSGAPVVTVTREAVPVSVVVRTKNRPALLREAVASIRANGYPHEIIVINDGGRSPGAIEGARLIEHEQSKGRAAAGNAGANAARGPWLVFLDDDDLYYPEHLETLAAAAESSRHHAGWYSDAVSSFLRPGPGGSFESHSRQRLFSRDFDREWLLLDNYIPLPALLMERQTFLDSGGFDSTFDLFEDWDFIIRLAARRTLLHVPVVTCEIRHFEGGDSITLAAPEGSDAFRAAKAKIWSKHRAAISDDVLSAVIERQKRRMQSLASELTEERGRRHHSDVDVVRLQREQSQLIAEMGRIDAAARAAERHIRVLEPQLVASEHERAALLQGVAALQSALDAAQADAASAHDAADRARKDTHRLALENQTSVGALYTEIHRLQSLLDTIYQSRTWKLHSIVEKARGRG